jgi:phosphoribosylamine--glycine ligase
MGAYSPAPVVTAEVDARIRSEIIEPTLRAMAAEGRPFTGFLYAGLMIMPDGSPKVIEFNARLGDPETQPILMRLKSDLLDLLEAAVDGSPKLPTPHWYHDAALGVVIAASGYPSDVRKGDAVAGLDAHFSAKAKVFHAGTTQRDGQVVTNGGRVFCVCGLGPTVGAAQSEAYSAVSRLSFDGAHYRKDIGYRAVWRERNKA